MSTPDLLVVAGQVSEELEAHGLVACGRRENGVIRVDFWTDRGDYHRLELGGEVSTVREAVSTCLALAGLAPSSRTIPLS